ncbi:unnamed protein product [Pleuronectes platessa]|uniref:Uncharacterized protein n=1 Tax=Pleuronectes platessa TaxID=8262 RepID=A0A9N7UUQ5_PLEPL|nr:unnamed protein product [Pleuronectes platessa]
MQEKRMAACLLGRMVEEIESRGRPGLILACRVGSWLSFSRTYGTWKRREVVRVWSRLVLLQQVSWVKDSWRCCSIVVKPKSSQQKKSRVLGRWGSTPPAGQPADRPLCLSAIASFSCALGAMSAAEEELSPVATPSTDEHIYSNISYSETQRPGSKQPAASNRRSGVTSERVALLVLSVLLAAAVIALGVTLYENTQTKKSLHNFQEECEAKLLSEDAVDPTHEGGVLVGREQKLQLGP